MSNSTYFMYKFKNSPIFLPILHDEKIREVLYENPGRVNIHYKTTIPEWYVFTISIDYAKAPFHLTRFLMSIENSSYEALMKEIEEQVNKKMWMNKEGLPLKAKSMASKVRQVLISISTMFALSCRTWEPSISRVGSWTKVEAKAQLYPVQRVQYQLYKVAHDSEQSLYSSNEQEIIGGRLTNTSKEDEEFRSRGDEYNLHHDQSSVRSRARWEN